MNGLPIIALLGIGILVMSTVGFGATLTNTPTFNLIGASDNNVVSTARGNVSNLHWTEEVNGTGYIETDLITFTVGNEDTSNAHIFEVCTVIEGPTNTFTPAAGSSPSCVQTPSIAANGIVHAQNVTIFPEVTVNNIVDISFSIEELN